MSNINQEYVEATKAIIEDHGLNFLMNVDTPCNVIAEALRQLANDYEVDFGPEEDLEEW